MRTTFNLLDEPWLPVRLTDGRIVEVGLIDAFRRSSGIAALADTSPPGLVAEYRLLLAILHRALTTNIGTWTTRDRARWHQEGLPVDHVIGYLEQWRERFWLIHPTHPFMQVAALATTDATRDKRKPWTQIALASANGNAPMVFDHACDISPAPLTYAHSITTLLGFLQFTPGGLVKTIRDADKAGALVNTAAVIPVGDTLAQTLSLGLHPAPLERNEPDLPAWERDPPTIDALRGEPMLTTGPNDRYTRLSRAVLFDAEADGTLRWLRFAAGLALGEDPKPDPMAAFRNGSNGPVRITFREGRAVWRDLPALVPAPSSGDARAASTLEWALAVHDRLDPDRIRHQPLLIAGVASDQAKLLRWRVEQITLPVALLQEADKTLALQRLVAEAESLHDALRTLAARMLAASLPDPERKDTLARAREMLDNGPLSTTFFAEAERALPALLACLATDGFDAADRQWRAVLRGSAVSAWRQVLHGMGTRSAALRADAKYRGRYLALLAERVPIDTSDRQEA